MQEDELKIKLSEARRAKQQAAFEARKIPATDPGTAYRDTFLRFPTFSEQLRVRRWQQSKRNSVFGRS